LAALHLFIENPFFGVGPVNRSLHAVTHASGLLTLLAGWRSFRSAQRDIGKMRRTGLFGFLSMLSVYFVPVYIFGERLNLLIPRPNCQLDGLCLVMGFFILD